MRLLVCGGREWNERDRTFAVLDAVHAKRPIALLIHGGARGADSLAGDWAAARGIPVQAFPADWQAHGRSAGPIRNQAMLTDGRPDGVVAFPGGYGTDDMMLRALEAGVKVWQPFKPPPVIDQAAALPLPLVGK